MRNLVKNNLLNLCKDIFPIFVCFSESTIMIAMQMRTIIPFKRPSKTFKFILMFLVLGQIIFLEKSEAQSKDASKLPYITVEKPKIRPLTELHQRLVIRSAISIAVKSQKYQFIFSSPKSFEDAKFGFFKLEMRGAIRKYGKNKEGYNLTYQIVDARSKEVVKEAKKTLVERRHLVYKSKVLLYELFFGKEKADEMEEELRLEAEREIKNALNNRKGGAGNPNPSNPVDRILGKDQKNENKDELKAVVDMPEKKEKKKAKRKKKKKPVRVAKFESPDLDLRKEQLDTKVKPPSSFKVYSEYSYGLDYSSLIVNSNSVIEVENDLRMVGVSVNAAIQLEENSLNRVHLGMNLNRITSENIFSVSAPRVFHVLYDFGSMESFIHFQGGLEFETQSFANLGARGEGIKAWDGTFLWIKAGAILDFNIGKRQYGFGGYFYSPFAGSSNFNALDSSITLTGSKFEVYFTGQVYKRWHVKVGFNQANITSQGLSNLQNQHSILSIGAIYK